MMPERQPTDTQIEMSRHREALRRRALQTVSPIPDAATIIEDWQRAMAGHEPSEQPNGRVALRVWHVLAGLAAISAALWAGLLALVWWWW